MKAPTVSRISDLSPGLFNQNYVRPLKPVIVTDAASGWAAPGKWSFAYLRDIIGDSPAIIGGKKLRLDGQSLTIAEFIEHAIADVPPADLPYLRAASIPAFYPELYADLQPVMPIMQPNRMTSSLLSSRVFDHPDGKLGYPELFIGAPGRGTPLLHYDVGYEHTFITQIIGDKEFFLFAPDQVKYLYPNELQPNQSNLTGLPKPDPEKFPLFANARMERIVVREGETLFIPCGWWHMSHLLTASVSISMNSVSRKNWQQFCNYRLSRVRKPYRRQLMRAYLAILGPVLTSAEALGFGRGKR